MSQEIFIHETAVVDEGCRIGAGSKVWHFSHLMSGAVCRKDAFAHTHVGRGATIGANATVVCGHNFGEYAFVGAGAVVTKDVPPFAMVVGNPASQMGWMSRRGCKLVFDEAGEATCPESGEKYRLVNGVVRAEG